MMRKNIELIKEEKKEGEPNIIDIKPESSLEKESEKIPTFFIQGWGDTVEYTRETYLKGMSKGDRRLLAVDYPKGIKIDKKENKEKKIPVDQLQRATVITEAIEKKGIEKVNAVAYSQGGIDLALAVQLRPDLFENLVFVNPAGIIGKDSFLGLAKRFVIDNGLQNLKIMKENPQWKDKLKDVQKSFKEFLFANPKLALQGVNTLSGADIFEQLKEIKNNGIKVSFICSVDDKVFEMDKIQELIKEEHLDGFYSIKGAHSNVKFDEKVQGAILEALETLEKK